MSHAQAKATLPDVAARLIDESRMEWRVWGCTTKPWHIKASVKWSHPYVSFDTEAEAYEWLSKKKKRKP